MTTQELNEFIINYVENDKTHMALMLTGAWGSGKTHYIEHELAPVLRKKKKDACVVVSLYSLEDLSDISKNIYMELRMPTFSKMTEGASTGVVVVKNVVKNIVGKVGIDISMPDEDLQKICESVNLKGKLLILEDIERSSIDIVKLLGYVNGLVERDGVKVLLVANEFEILKKENKPIKFAYDFSGPRKKTSTEDEPVISDDVKKYVHIKEKTICDTIQFSYPLTDSIKGIINEFDNQTIKDIVDEDSICELASIVQASCKRNLRTFIFALQKASDIFEKVDGSVVENDKEYYKCVFCGIIQFASRIKTDEFPKWEGTEFLSTKLGSNDMPLMRFAYNYIRWQIIDLSKIKEHYNAFKDYRFYEKNSDYKDSDLRVLAEFHESTEETVLGALENVEKKLCNPKEIGIYAYSKLAYYMTFVASTVGFDGSSARKRMIENAKGLGKEKSVDSELFFLGRYDISDKEIRAEYEQFISKLSNAINDGKDAVTFSYLPGDIESLYDDICKNTIKYTSGHRFISKYCAESIVRMLENSSAKQIGDFRGILFAAYRYASKGNFVSEDIETLQELRQLVNYSKYEGWDKIQKLQIDYLCSNIDQFISQMS